MTVDATQADATQAGVDRPRPSSNDELITLIVPVYNVADYLGACLTSILEQTYRNIQVIIVNDGSTDASTRICRDFAAKDDRILLIEQENGGLSCARNSGLERASGDYISFVDSDDSLEPDYLECLHEAICTWDADFAACGYHITDEGGAIIGEAVLDEGLHDECGFWETMGKQDSLNVYVWNKLYRRDFIADSRFIVGCGCEDHAFHLEVLQRARRVYFISRPLYRYRTRSTSLTHLPVIKANLDPIQYDIATCDYLKEKGYDACIPPMLHRAIAHLVRAQPEPGNLAEEERYRSYREDIGRIYREEAQRGSLSPLLERRYWALKLLGARGYKRLSRLLRRVRPSS